MEKPQFPFKLSLAHIHPFFFHDLTISLSASAPSWLASKARMRFTRRMDGIVAELFSYTL
ncbi:MAG: hypothetical protein J0H48_00485 [Nitrosospira multiformis]|nr:hypothetical protein [Nitrosospira multiformis]